MIVSRSFGSPAFSVPAFSASRVVNSSAMPALDEDPPRRHADLALVQEGAERRRVHRVVEVGVVEDDQRVVAAELEHDALQLPSGRLGEPPSRLRRAREVEAPHRRVLDELVADRRSVAGRVRDDVQHAGGQARLGEDLAPDQPADDRRELGRLQHDRVARARAAPRSSAPTGSAPRSTARSPRRRRPACGCPSRASPGGRTGSPARSARRRAPPPGGAGRARTPAGTCRSRRSRPSRARAATTTSSSRLSSTSAAFRKIRWRSAGTDCDHAGKASAAAAIARAASARVPAGASATTSPVNGSRSSNVEPAATHSPPMNCWYSLTSDDTLTAISSRGRASPARYNR